MKQILIFTLILFCFFSTSFGQKAQLTVGSDFHKPKSWGEMGECSHKVSFKGKTPDGYYLFEIQEQLSKSTGLRDNNTLFIYEKYDTTSFKRVLSKSIETNSFITNEKNEYVWVYETKVVEDSLYILFSVYNQKQGTKCMMLVSCNQNNLVFSAPRKLFEIKDLKLDLIVGGSYYENPEKNRFFYIGDSEDGSKTVIYYNRDDILPNGRTINLQVWTKDFSSFLWEKEITTENKHTGEFPDIILDENANVYMYVANFEKKNLNQQLIRITQFGEEVVTNPIDFGEYNIASAGYKFDENGTLKVTGHYKKEADFVGTFSYDFPLSQQKPTPVKLMKLESKKEEDRKKDTHTNLDKISGTHIYMGPILTFNTDNGDEITLVEEMSSESGSNGFWKGQPVISYEYRYYDIIASRTNKNGTVLWSHRIPKRQFEKQHQYQICSFYYQQDGENVQLFYNEDSEATYNVEEKKLKIFRIPMREKDKGAFVKVTISPDGTYKKDILYEFDKDGAIPMVMTMRPNGKNQAVLGVSKNSSFTLGKLSW
jgi:hypothetical protein